MGLAEDLKAEQEASRPGVRCSVARALDALVAADRKVAEENLAKPPEEMPHAVLSRVLTRTVGFKVPPDQLSKHRAGGCCGPR